jgi:hypothetical protein
MPERIQCPSCGCIRDASEKFCMGCADVEWPALFLRQSLEEAGDDPYRRWPLILKSVKLLHHDISGAVRSGELWFNSLSPRQKDAIEEGRAYPDEINNELFVSYCVWLHDRLWRSAGLTETLLDEMNLELSGVVRLAVGAAESALGTPRSFSLEQFADDLESLRHASSLLATALEVPVGLPDLGPTETPQPTAVSATSGNQSPTETDESRDEEPTEVPNRPATKAAPKTPGSRVVGVRGKPLKEPPRIAFIAYKMHKEMGLKQTEVAKKLQGFAKIPFDQSKVSKYCQKVRKWYGAGGETPTGIPREITMDPNILQDILGTEDADEGDHDPTIKAHWSASRRPRKRGH